MAVDKLVDSGALDSGLTSIADKIRSRSGGSNQLAFPAGFVSEIDNIPTDGGGAEEKDVNFYDYDGTLVTSYSKTEFLALTEMPANPTHTGLAFQEWNWTLADAKEYVTDYGKLNIGATYTTSDGKTRIYIELRDGYTEPYLYLILGVANIRIDWGDGVTERASGNGNQYIQHTYNDEGSYVITIEVLSGSIAIPSGSSTFGSRLLTGRTSVSVKDGADQPYRNAITNVELGANITSLNNYAFMKCYNLETISIPGNISIQSQAFSECQSLQAITIPSGVTTIPSSLCKNCYSLKVVNLPRSITAIASEAFSNGIYRSITIPDHVTDINDSSFTQNRVLQEVIIPDSLSNVTGFSNGYSIREIYIPEGPTTVSFAQLYNLEAIDLPFTLLEIRNLSNSPKLEKVYIPDDVTTINASAFYNDYSLRDVNIPDGVTVIKNSTFYNCYSLTSITIPENVTSIERSAFYSCLGMKEYHLKPTTPPTLENWNAFQSIPADCVIYVPAGTLSAYQSATNWSTYASKMQEE